MDVSGLTGSTTGTFEFARTQLPCTAGVYLPTFSVVRLAFLAVKTPPLVVENAGRRRFGIFELFLETSDLAWMNPMLVIPGHTVLLDTCAFLQAHFGVSPISCGLVSSALV
jgi:hypothetical protein